jgi:hypothetical protein
MADEKITIDLEIVDNTENSIKGLKELKKLLRTLPADSEAFGVVSNKINDIEDALKGAKKGTADLVDTLASAPGPLGALGKGLNSLKVATVSFGAALKAAGIGLLVSIIGGIAAAFNSVEGSGKKLEPLLIGFEKILGGILEVIQPLLDAFLELALKALPYITKGIGMLYSGFVAFFTLIKEAGTGVGNILIGIFTLDTDRITKGWETLKGSWGKTVVAYEKGVESYEKGSNRLTKTEKENAKTRQELRDKEYADIVKKTDAINQLQEARIEKAKALALSLVSSEEDKLKIETKFAADTYNLQKKNLEDRLALAKKYGQDTTEIQTQLIKLEATYINTVAGNNEKLKELRKANLDNLIKARDEYFQIQVKGFKDNQALFAQDIAEREAKDIQNLYSSQQAIAELAEFARESDEKRYALAKKNRQRDLDDAKFGFDSRLYTELEYKDKVIAINKDFDATQDEILSNAFKRSIDLLNAEKELRISAANSERELLDIRLNSYQLYANGLSAIFSYISSVQKEGSDIQATLAKIAVYIQSAAAVAQVVLKGKQAFADYTAAGATATANIIAGGTLLSNPVTAPIGVAMVAAGKVALAASKAGQIATVAGGIAQVAVIGANTAMQIQAIDQAARGSAGAMSSGGGGSAGGGTSAGGGGTPAFSTPTIGAPQIGPTGSQQGQLAAVVAGALDRNNSQGRPIRAYVVGNDITSEQQLQRRLRAAARLGG